jgi:hypothetical protein
LKQFREKNARSRLSVFGYFGEFLLGVYMLGMSITSHGIASVLWSQWLIFAIGIILISHSLYLIFRFYYDKRWMHVLELLFSDAKETEE